MSEIPGSTEVLQKSDEVLATLFRVSYLHERGIEMTSGTMYRPSETKILQSFHKLFNFEGQNIFNDGEVRKLEEWASTTFNAMNGFLNEKTRVQYGTSYPQGPIPGQKPNELMRFRPSHDGDECPSGLFFIYGNQLMFEMKFKKDTESQKGVVQEIEPIDSDLIEKVRKMLLSKDFENNFNKLEEQLSYEPKEDLHEWASY
jgi:hypothetical protein